ncbi:orotate phosphoribosyltransferase [Cryphonectria parasitica EP155]|uniref:Orotate phosphoribosyltransferase n=1 Tax=Cryphonectria parasitica (strain ATCC 38755 / EP155) TaxID=660469 RepID=A0A9P4Y756_CRYP1|nr:orotate phosphoribosyltransferase [Cryphonectria parasitica EP155]KAF3767684.1 orotate phosphoribosyltransferase [Cryphonectria parasitica EP155]
MSSTLAPYKAEFLQAALEGGVLKFGSFELKSKRISPYFFNAGDFYTSKLQSAIGTAFAKAIIEARTQIPGFDFDIVFGPAYKGIPLATLTNLKLGELDPASHADTLCSFDRKEAKDHGEGGNIVGAPLKGKRVLIIDDVITAGTAKREAIEKIRKEGGTVAGIVVAVDRMEKLTSPDGDDSKPMPSAMGELRKELGAPVFAILTLDDIIDGIKNKSLTSAETIKSIEEYRTKFKASD